MVGHSKMCPTFFTFTVPFRIMFVDKIKGVVFMAEVNLKKCPICIVKTIVNKISRSEFFCVNCLNEFKIKQKHVFLVNFDEKGTINDYRHVANI